MFAIPFSSKNTLISFVITVGVEPSNTYIIDFFSVLFPFRSATVKVTMFGPKSTQLKVVLSKTMVSIPQLSKLDIRISAVDMFTSPVESKNTTISS